MGAFLQKGSRKYKLQKKHQKNLNVSNFSNIPNKELSLMSTVNFPCDTTYADFSLILTQSSLLQSFSRFLMNEYCPSCKSLVRSSGKKQSELRQIITTFEKMLNKNQISDESKGFSKFATIRRAFHSPRLHYPELGDFHANHLQICLTNNIVITNSSDSMIADDVQNATYEELNFNNDELDIGTFPELSRTAECLQFLQIDQNESPRCLGKKKAFVWD